MSCPDIWLESQLFRESESSLKFFFCPGVRCITLFASEFVHCDDHHHCWRHDHNHHMFSPLALDLFWAEIQNLSLVPGDQAGLASSGPSLSELSSTTGRNVNRGTQDPDQASSCYQPSSVSLPSQGWAGGEYVEISWKIDSRGTPSLSWVMSS